MQKNAPKKSGRFLFFSAKYSHNTQKCIIFVLQKRKTDMKVELTEKEWDLIESIRNYHKAYPNGNAEQEWYITTLLQELLDRNWQPALGH